MRSVRKQWIDSQNGSIPSSLEWNLIIDCYHETLANQDYVSCVVLALTSFLLTSCHSSMSNQVISVKWFCEKRSKQTGISLNNASVRYPIISVKASMRTKPSSIQHSSFSVRSSISVSFFFHIFDLWFTLNRISQTTEYLLHLYQFHFILKVLTQNYNNLIIMNNFYVLKVKL